MFSGVSGGDGKAEKLQDGIVEALPRHQRLPAARNEQPVDGGEPAAAAPNIQRTCWQQGPLVQYSSY